MSWRSEFWLLVLAALVTGCLAIKTCSSPRSRAERTFGWILVAQSAWIIGQLAELSLDDLQHKVWADGLQYLPMMSIGALQLLFASQYAGRGTCSPSLVAYAALALPALTFLVGAPIHGKVRGDARIAFAEPFPTLHYSYTPWDWWLIVLGLGTSAWAITQVFGQLLKVRRRQALRALPVVVGLVLPTAVGLVSLSTGFRILGQRDVSFFFFGLAGLIVLAGLRRSRTVVAVPIAREVVFHRIPDAAIVVDHSGVVVELNRAGCEFLGVSDEREALGRPLGAFDSAFLAPDYLLQLEDGRSRTAEGAAGRWWEITAHEMSDVGAKVYLARDATERERARRRMESHRDELERKFGAIFDRTFQLMVVLDPQGRVVEANRASLTMVGVSSEEVVGRTYWETPWWRHCPRLRQRVEEGIQRASRGNFARFEATHSDHEGGERMIDFSLKPVTDASGSVTLIIAEGRDITDLRFAERRFEQSQKLEAMGRLAGGVAHDFNNWLTVIHGNVSLAKEDAQDSEIVEYLSHAEEAAGHAAQLTAQLLAFGRKSLLLPEAQNLKEVIVQQVRLLQRVIPENIRVRLEVEDDVPFVLFDPSQLQQVLLNLAINARDAMPQGGTLTLGARRIEPQDDEPWALLFVQDTGVGMSVEQQRRVFEPFYTTKDPGKGTGLGLAMVYGAVSQHGGLIEVRSRLGQGSRFEVRMPGLEAAETEKPAQSMLRGPMTHRGQGRVILVEDESAVRQTLSTVLQRGGHSVDCFESADQLLGDSGRGLRSLPIPDLVIVDAVMPGVSGFELVHRLGEIWPNVPLLLMSGYSGDERLGEALRAGAHFLSKPFTPDDLLARVRDLVALWSDRRRIEA